MGGDIIFIAVFPSVNQSFCLGLIIQTFLRYGFTWIKYVCPNFLETY